MSGEQTTAIEQRLTIPPVLYIGGFPRYLVGQLDLPVVNGIIGCMHSLQVDKFFLFSYVVSFVLKFVSIFLPHAYFFFI